MRLTFKAKNPFTGKEQYYPDSVYDDENIGEKMVDFNKQTECNNKLGRLEDLEDELGIDLVAVCKALKEGIYYKKDKNAIEHFIPNDEYHLVLDCNGSTEKFNYWLLSIVKIDTNEYIDDFWVSNYGEAWALTKEELERDLGESEERR